jgi:hypothetical protein
MASIARPCIADRSSFRLFFFQIRHYLFHGSYCLRTQKYDLYAPILVLHQTDDSHPTGIFALVALVLFVVMVYSKPLPLAIVLNGREVADVYEVYYLGAGVVLLCCAWAFQVRSKRV